jgi:hypothetical protein
MHAHERTLLARLGFADPDRRDPLHDIACRYLAKQPVYDRLTEMLATEFPRQDECRADSGFESRFVVDTVIRGFRAKPEVEISKGSGQYRTTVGFVDVLLTAVLDIHQTNFPKRRISENGNQEPWPPCEGFTRVCSARVAIEVKTSPLPVGDIVRQINLYRSYSDFDTWILATTFPLTQSQSDFLAYSRILHIYLGERFQDFVKEQANSPCSNSVEV